MLIYTQKGDDVMSAKHILDLTRIDEKYNSFGKINLVQIGRLKCDPGHVIGRHTHLNWFELTCVTDGEGEIYGGETKVDVKKGDIFLSFPCEVHKIISSVEAPLTFDHFALSVNDTDYNERLERLMAGYANPKKRVFTNYLIKEMLEGSINEILGKAEFKKDYLEASFSLILLEILKIFEVKRDSGFISDGTSQDPEKMCRTVKNYIDTHLFSIGSLTEIADLCGYNYSYLSYLFRKVTGITLSDYYKSRRFESAKLMIRENKLRISEISNLLGYNSVYAFSKAFKDEFGMSPKNYYKTLFSESEE